MHAISSRVSLALILGLQAVVPLLALHNTAFQDEALYLYAGRQLIHHWLGGPAPLDHYAFYFSGYPGVYPVIGGALDMIGGLQLARAFSTVCMLGVTSIVYFVAKKLLPAPSEVFAAAAYASLGTVMFIGRFATFDALCLLLISLAVAMALRSGRGRVPWMVVAIGPTLVLAILAKYAALLFVPSVLGILGYRSLVEQGWKRAAANLGIATGAFGLSVAVAYLLIDKAALHAISGSTTNRTPILPQSRLELLTYVIYMGGVVFALAFLALMLSRRERHLRGYAVLLFGSSLLAPAYHIYKGESISLDKHMAFALFFVAPLAGYALAWMSGYVRRTGSNRYQGHWLVGVAVILAIFTLGIRQATTLYTGWANTSSLQYVLQTQLRDGSGHILAEDIEISRYDARNITQQWQWNGLQFYYYYANGLNHPPVLGNPALADALRHRYFAFVELSFNYHLSEANFVAQSMAATRNYDLVAVVPFQNSFGRGHFFVFRLALRPKGGDFTRVDQVTTKSWYKCEQRVCQP